MPISAFKLITPTSIVVAGGTASVGQFGKVSFSAATSLSLNGVFSSTYDNYMVVGRYVGTANLPSVMYRLRVSGSDATGANYANQYLYATSTSVTAARASSQTAGQAGIVDDEQRSGDVMYFFGPYLAQPTAHRHVSVAGHSGGTIFDDATTHSLSTSYDGITFYPSSGSFSGEIAVYGCNQ